MHYIMKSLGKGITLHTPIHHSKVKIRFHISELIPIWFALNCNTGIDSKGHLACSTNRLPKLPLHGYWLQSGTSLPVYWKVIFTWPWVRDEWYIYIYIDLAGKSVIGRVDRSIWFRDDSYFCKAIAGLFPVIKAYWRKFMSHRLSKYLMVINEVKNRLILVRETEYLKQYASINL